MVRRTWVTVTEKGKTTCSWENSFADVAEEVCFIRDNTEYLLSSLQRFLVVPLVGRVKLSLSYRH